MEVIASRISIRSPMLLNARPIPHAPLWRGQILNVCLRAPAVNGTTVGAAYSDNVQRTQLLGGRPRRISSKLFAEPPRAYAHQRDRESYKRQHVGPDRLNARALEQDAARDCREMADRVEQRERQIGRASCRERG